MPSYVETYDETKPAGTRALSLGDDDIRELKRAFRERLATDHKFAADETGLTTIGYHLPVHLIDNTTDPTAVATTGILYSKTASGVIELFYLDAAGNITQITASGVLAGVPTGMIILFDGAACPTGYTRVSALDGALVKLGATYAAPAASAASELPAHPHTGPLHQHPEFAHEHNLLVHVPGQNMVTGQSGAGSATSGIVASTTPSDAAAAGTGNTGSAGTGTVTTLLACKKN